MMLKSAFRVNDFISVNGSSMSNGIGSGTVIEITDTTITTRAQFTDETFVLHLGDMERQAQYTCSDFTRFISIRYYWR